MDIRLLHESLNESEKKHLFEILSDEFNNQSNSKSVENFEPLYDKSKLKRGDYVFPLFLNGNTKNLTVGKKYYVFETNPGIEFARPLIKNDINKTYSLKLNTGQWAKAE